MGSCNRRRMIIQTSKLLKLNLVISESCFVFSAKMVYTLYLQLTKLSFRKAIGLLGYLDVDIYYILYIIHVESWLIHVRSDNLYLAFLCGNL
jgi:hypothetical protein